MDIQAPLNCAEIPAVERWTHESFQIHRRAVRVTSSNKPSLKMNDCIPVSKLRDYMSVSG